MKTYLMSCICAVLLAVSCNQAIGAEAEPAAAVVDQAASTELAVEKIDVNTADVAELSGLPGIGPKIAERIDAYRQANGPFKSIDDLMEVKGIGPAKFEKLKSLITVS
jgi:competence protein ComEA